MPLNWCLALSAIAEVFRQFTFVRLASIVALAECTFVHLVLERGARMVYLRTPLYGHRCSDGASAYTLDPAGCSHGVPAYT